MSIFNKNSEPRPTTSMMLIIRIAVGGYLEYLAFSLYDGLERPITSSNMLIAIATGVFFVAGIIFIALPLRDLLQGRYEGGVNDPNIEITSESIDTQNDEINNNGDDVNLN